MEEEYIASERLMSINTAARILTRSRDYVIHLLDTGQLPFIPCGAHRKIHRSDLKKFITDAKKTAETTFDPKLSHRHGRKPPVIQRRPASSCIADPEIQALFN